ncbi:MAG: PepSY-like domain-containing protein [Sedimentisphaerales bacterium]|nr:PepSY-like domain-containing protein [Sedimentisphaerales bacterium]
MKRTLTLLSLVALAVAVGVVMAGDARELSLDQIPAEAREALLHLAGGAQIVAVEREKEHGMELYEAEWKKGDGLEAEAKVMASGDLVEMEEEIDAAALPANVKAAVAKRFPAGAKLECEKVTLLMYEIEAKVNGKERGILVLPTGKILGKALEGDDDDDDDDGDDGEDEQRVSLDQLPPVVKATILAEAKGAKIKEIERETTKNGAVYEAEWVENGHDVEIKVAPDGKILKREVEQEDDADDDDDDEEEDDDDK